MNSVFSVSPFVSSIFFSESALKIFPIFLDEFRGQFEKQNFSKKSQFS